MLLQAEAKTPSDDNKTIQDVLQKANLTDSMIDTMSESMIAGMESEVESCAASSGVSSQPASDFSSQPGSDVSNPVTGSDATLECLTSGASSLEQTIRLEAPKILDNNQDVDLLSSGVADLNVEAQIMNGNSAVPMDTSQAMDFINGHSNGVDNSTTQHSRYH